MFATQQKKIEDLKRENDGLLEKTADVTIRCQDTEKELVKKGKKIAQLDGLNRDLMKENNILKVSRNRNVDGRKTGDTSHSLFNQSSIEPIES